MQPASKERPATKASTAAPRRAPDSGVPTTSYRRRSRRRLAYVLSILALFLTATVIALRQEPWRDPYRRPDVLSADWWLSPVEHAAHRRLVGVTALRGVYLTFKLSV
jgi:hypothetical protein